MKTKTFIYTLSLGAMSLFTSTLYAQMPAATSEKEQAHVDSMRALYRREEAQSQKTKDENNIKAAENAQKEAEAKAKEAKRIEKEANDALKESRDAVKAEKKAQKAREEAEEQKRKAEEARKKSEKNLK